MTHSLCFFDGNIFASSPLAISEVCLLTTSSLVNKPSRTALVSPPDIRLQWEEMTLPIVSTETSQIFQALKDAIYQPA